MFSLNAKLSECDSRLTHGGAAIYLSTMEPKSLQHPDSGHAADVEAMFQRAGLTMFWRGSEITCITKWMTAPDRPATSKREAAPSQPPR